MKFDRGMNSMSLAIAPAADRRSRSLRTRLFRSTFCEKRRPSYDAKKNVLPLAIGPPRFAPNWLRLKGGGSLEVKVKKLRASSALLRRNSNASPWNWLAPERVARLSTAPELCPYSALNVELSILNSWTVLIEGWNRISLKVKSFSVMPLTR